jgi:hypothetical protein
MEIIGVVMLSFVGCFIALIITLVFFNFIILMSDEDKPKAKVLTRGYDVHNKQDSQELFDAVEMPPTVGLNFNTAPPNKSATCASNETPPSHKTRVTLRKKRKSKQ